jgi:hypothetical protein
MIICVFQERKSVRNTEQSIDYLIEHAMGVTNEG